MCVGVSECDVCAFAQSDLHFRMITLWCGKEMEGGKHGGRRPVRKGLS